MKLSSFQILEDLSKLLKKIVFHREKEQEIVQNSWGISLSEWNLQNCVTTKVSPSEICFL